MYNEELKKSFIAEYSNKFSTIQMCVVLFNNIAPYEQRWNKDWCTQPEEVLKPIVFKVIPPHSKNQSAKLAILKRYTQWCVGTGYPAAIDGMSDINPSAVMRIREQLVSSPAMLKMYLDNIYDDDSLQSTDSIYKCYHWLAFMGVAETDMLNVRCADVDIVNMDLSYGGRKLPIYRESLSTFKNCAQLNEFYYIHPKYTTWRNRQGGDSLLRGVRFEGSEEVTITSIKTYIARRATRTKKKPDSKHLSYYRLWISGVFFRALELEVSGIEPDFNEAAISRMPDSYVPIYGDRTYQIQQKRKTNALAEEYCLWKMAFVK